MKECKCGKIPPCYGSLEFAIYEDAKKVNDEWKKSRILHGKMIDKLRAKLMEGGFLDDTHDKVYELNKQMCDIDKHLSEAGYFGMICEGQVEARKKLKDMKEEKTKKMTKAEAFEYLEGTKVKCYERSNALYCELVEKITTECGCVYNGFMSPPDVSVFAIHIDAAGYIRHLCTVDADKYNELKCEELSADDILSIEIIEDKKNEFVDCSEPCPEIKAVQELLRNSKHLKDKIIVITKDNAAIL